MRAPALPSDEATRLATLYGLALLDSAAEERFDRVTRLAAATFDLPISLVSLVDADRTWFKSRNGIAVSETSRASAFCSEAILGDGSFVVEDATGDSRFAEYSLVAGGPRVRFYAGTPVRARNGAKLGTLSVMGSAPRSWTAADDRLLGDLGAMVDEQLALVDLALVDDGTGLPNRRGFTLVASYAIAHASRQGEPVSLVRAVVDGLEDFAGTRGLEAANAVTRELSVVVSAHARGGDVPGRIASDEFAMLLPDTDHQGAERFMVRLEQSLAALANHDEHITLSVSVGASSCEPHSGAFDLEELMERADQALCAARLTGSRPVDPATGAVEIVRGLG